jgi:hypothetical protein
MGEDAACTYPAFLKADTIVIDNEFCPYHYRYVPSSMARSMDNSYFAGISIVYDYLQRTIGEANGLKRQVEYYRIYLIKLGMSRLWERKNTLDYKSKKAFMEKTCQAYADFISPECKELELPMGTRWELFCIRKHWWAFLNVYVYVEKSLRK